MYTVDDKDRVIALEDFPQSSVGAPVPVIVSDEFTTVVAFYLQHTPEDWEGAWVRIVSRESEGEPLAIVRFKRCYAYSFGPPNDEAFSGHPLAGHGLSPYGAFEVKDSSWLRQLEKMNSAHHCHDAERFLQRKHYILTFHDSTFECIADGFTIEIGEGPLNSLFPRMVEMLA